MRRVQAGQLFSASLCSGIFCALSENVPDCSIRIRSRFYFHISFAIFSRTPNKFSTPIPFTNFLRGWGQESGFSEKIFDRRRFSCGDVQGRTRDASNAMGKGGSMLPILGLFEAHLTVKDLERAKKFYGGVLGLELARAFPERRVAFYWLGERGKSMLGLWETGSGPQRIELHVAFAVHLPDLLQVGHRLHAAGVTARDFERRPADEPDVLAWMPAAALYFEDPDGNQLEFLAMLPDEPRPELGVLRWSAWQKRRPVTATRPSSG
jgi:lactoylglutathione lyase